MSFFVVWTAQFATPALCLSVYALFRLHRGTGTSRDAVCGLLCCVWQLRRIHSLQTICVNPHVVVAVATYCEFCLDGEVNVLTCMQCVICRQRSARSTDACQWEQASGADLGFHKGGCPIHLKGAPEVGRRRSNIFPAFCIFKYEAKTGEKQLDH